MNAATTALENKIAAAVIETVNKPNVAAQYQAARPIIEAVTDKIGPEIINATNNEPWYQSRVILGSLAAMVATVLAIFGITFDLDTQSKVIDLIVVAAPLIGSAYALYGRLTVKKPIGQ